MVWAPATQIDSYIMRPPTIYLFGRRNCETAFEVHGVVCLCGGRRGSQNDVGEPPWNLCTAIGSFRNDQLTEMPSSVPIKAFADFRYMCPATAHCPLPVSSISPPKNKHLTHDYARANGISVPQPSDSNERTEKIMFGHVNGEHTHSLGLSPPAAPAVSTNVCSQWLVLINGLANTIWRFNISPHTRKHIDSESVNIVSMPPLSPAPVAFGALNTIQPHGLANALVLLCKYLMPQFINEMNYPVFWGSHDPRPVATGFDDVSAERAQQ